MQEIQVLTCPRCQRELRALRTPHCLWCGETIPDADYLAVAVAAPHRSEVDLPPLNSYNMQTRTWQNPYGQVNQRPLQKWEIKFRKAFAIAAGVFLVIKLCDVIYVWYVLHRMMAQMPH